jgi:GNAT superfamily N-acetyltransferase
MAWIVRLAGAGDCDEVQRVLKSAYPILFAPGHDRALLAGILPVITRPNPNLLASGRYFVAELDGRLLGCGGWSHQAPGRGQNRKGLGHLRHFATHADFASMGVGRSLYDSSAAQAQSEGITEFEVVSTLNGEGFYRTLGFEVLEPVEERIAGLLLPAIRMHRSLAAAG